MNPRVELMKVLIIIILLIFSHQNKENALDNSIWELAKNKNEIKIYTRQAEGSAIQEFKAITNITAKMKSLESLIDKVSEYPDWQVNVASAKILKQVNLNEQSIYYTSDIPWPFMDRDIVVNTHKTINKKGIVTYSISSSPDYIKEKEDFVRIRNAKGKWQFTPKEDGKIEVIYQFYADPAGSLPNWIINLFIVGGPYETFINLKAKIEGQRKD